MTFIAAGNFKRLPVCWTFMSKLLFSLTALLLFLPLTDAFALELTPLKIPRVSRAPRLSDFATGEPREAEIVITTFLQFDPHDGQPVTQPTTAFLSYDDKNLYIGWICKDNPALIRARVAPRKQIMSDDRVTINIDTFQDHKHAYWFDVNPYGVQFDGRTTDGIGDDPTWEGLWYSEGRITGDGYVVLETIPFKTLRFPKGDKQIWNICLARMIQRTNEYATWPRITHKLSPQYVGQFVPIEIEGDISSGRNVQLIPYEVYSRENYLSQKDGFKQDNQVLPGLDAKMVLHDALTLDLTANPDFSEIGSDDPKVTVNQRFEVIYPERRPFFLENASVFSTPETLFFSRRIAHPQFGAKMTGSLGRWNLGALAADDRAPGEVIAAGQNGHGKRAIDGVFRGEREFGHQSHLGLLLSNTSFEGSSNRVGSIDFRYLAAHNWTLSGEGTTSQTRSMDGKYSAGPGYALGLDKNDQHIKLSSSYTDRSPGLQATLGYLDRTDIRFWENFLNYEWKPVRNKTVLAFGPLFRSVLNYDHEKRLENWLIAGGFDISLPRLTYVSVRRSESYELFQGIGFRKHSTSVYSTQAWIKWLETGLSYSQGTGINYYPAAALPPFLGHSNSIASTVTIYPNSHFRLDEIYFYWRFATQPNSSASATMPSAVVFTNHILRSKLNYQFNRNFAFRAILDYNALLPNAALVSTGYSKTADTTLLFTFLPHPGTAVYVGYSDTFQNMDFDRKSLAYSTTTLPGLSTDRQVFVKVSYLLRF